MASSVFIFPGDYVIGDITVTGEVLASDGSAAAPSYSFASDPDNGLYRIGANNVGASAGGSLIFDWNASRVLFAQPINALVVDSGAASNLLLKYNGTTKVTIGTSEAIFADQITGSGTIQAGSSFKWSGGGSLTNVADTDVSVLNSASNAYISLRAQNYKIGTVVMVSGTAPTIASGFGTSPSIVASNGSAAFTVNVGTGGTASAGVITMPAATTGWIAHVENLTGTLGNYANQRTVQTASTTTSITLENQTISTGAVLAWTASDVLVVTCVGY